MTTKDKIIVAEQVCEFAVGWTVGGIVHSIVKPKGFVDNVFTSVGTVAIAFLAGRAVGKAFTEICDKNFDIDISDKLV